MKRKLLIKLLYDSGWKFLRYGANHDIFIKDGQLEQVPRHNDIPEPLAKAIIRKRGLKND